MILAYLLNPLDKSDPLEYIPRVFPELKNLWIGMVDEVGCNIHYLK
jgi:hypothetical protein